MPLAALLVTLNLHSFDPLLDQLDRTTEQRRTDPSNSNIMADDNADVFAGMKKKSKKKQVQIAELDVEGDDAPAPAAAAAAAAAASEDPVRPLEKSADLTLKGDEPLDFSDLKKVGGRVGRACLLGSRASKQDRDNGQ